MADTFSFEEARGPTAGGDKFVAADRTSKRKRSTVSAGEKVRGELPKDKTILKALQDAADEFGVPREYALALAQQESGYNPNAHNKEFGADGLMQFIKATAEGHGLKYGVDTRDPSKAAKAAMKDFAAQMAIGGTEWAIKHHFAGPDERGHGPKTQQYLADVSKRADDIRQLLASGDNPAAVAGMGGSSDAGPKQAVGSTFSFEEALGPGTEADNTPPAKAAEKPSLAGFARDQILEGHGKDFLLPVVEGAKKGFAYIQKRLQEDYTTVARTPEEIAKYRAETPLYSQAKFGNDPGHQDILQSSAESESQEILDRNKPEPDAPAGFLANIKNPVDLLMNDSLPANVVEWLATSPESQRKKFFDARKVAMQEHIVANPQSFPPVSVQEAQRAIDERKAKQDPTIRKMWDQLTQAAKEDPGRFGAQFANALMADPELMMAPEGIGLKLIRGGRKAAGMAATSSRAMKLADKIIDAGTTGASMNLAIEAAAAGSEGREMTSEEAAFTMALGGGVSAAFAGVFARGARARAKLKDGTLKPDDLEAAMRDAAQEELIVEDLVETPKTDAIYDSDGRPLPADVRTRIEHTLGIEKMSPDERKAWHKKRQAEIAKTFKENWDEADYLKYKADERMSRAQTLAADAEAKSAQAAADAAKQKEVDAFYAKHGEVRKALRDREYTKALAARDKLADADTEAAAYAEEDLRTATAKMDQEDIMHAAFESEGAVRDAMLRAAARDKQLRVPKWQRGEADPQMIARLGVGSLFAGAGYAFADPDKKVQTAFVAGLAGLLIPGGGKVFDRLRQSGMVSDEGSIIGLLVKQGKMKVAQEAGDLKIKERELVERAKKGDQQAYKELYEEHFPRIKRFLKQYVREAGPKLGVDADDVAQETFIQAFKNLDKFSGDSQLYTWLHSIAKNEGLQAIRSAKTQKGGGEYDFVGTDLPDVKDPYGEAYSQDVFDKGTAADMDTPENQLIRQQTEQTFIKAIEDLPERDRLIFLLHRVEQYDTEEIAKMMGVSPDNVRQILSRTQKQVETNLEKGFKAKRVEQATSAEPEVKRGRGRPRKIQAQVGEIDPKLLKLGAVAAIGAGAGAYLNDQNKLLGAGIGALIGLALNSKSVRGETVHSQITKAADYALGVTSTRIMNKSQALWRRAIEHERIVLRDTHTHMKNVDPFLTKLQKLPKETRDILHRAILTGKAEVTTRLLNQIGDKTLIEAWKNTRSSLDSLGDQLVALRRFKKQDIDYFPRIVKDVAGLLKAIGKERGSYLEEALKTAEEKSLRGRGTGLTDLERSQIINKVLKEDRWASQQPGYAKNRAIEEITPELQQYYASPTEALHSYIRSAVEDIQRAKFFGEDLKVIEKGGKEYTNVGESIGTLVNRLMNEGKLASKDAEEVAGLLRSRFLNGEKAPAGLIQASKNLSYAGLLGNPFSAATQLGDVIIQAYTQDIRATLGALTRKLTGRKIVSMKDFGLSDHIAEEFVSTSKTAKFLNKVFKFSLFKGVDEFGKDIGLNAAILRYQRLSKSEAGIRKIVDKYSDALGQGEIKQLVTDLQKGEPTDLVRSIAFAELSRSQPITRLELPQAYLDNPNGRLLYQFKTFMLKQADMARRDGYNEIKAGRVAKGIKQLTELGIVLGVAGTTTQKIRDFMLGKDVEFELTDIPMNMFKTFGLTEYFIDHAFGVSKEEAAERRKAGEKGARSIPAEPIQTALGMAAPPAQVFDQIVTADPKAVRYIPFIGPYWYEQVKAEQAKGGKK